MHYMGQTRREQMIVETIDGYLAETPPATVELQVRSRAKAEKTLKSIYAAEGLARNAFDVADGSAHISAQGSGYDDSRGARSRPGPRRTRAVMEDRKAPGRFGLRAWYPEGCFQV